MGAILLARHAQASFGSADYDVLSDLGAHQAEALKAALEARGLTPSLLVSGDMRRQRDTALPWTRDGAELRIDPRWNEYDSGGVLRAHAEIAASLERTDDAVPLSNRDFQAALDPALHRWIESGTDGGAGEAWSAFRERTTGALHDLAAEVGRGETALVFTSGGVIAACVAALLELPDRAVVPLNRVAVNTALTKVISGRSGLSLVSYNEHAHVETAQLLSYR